MTTIFYKALQSFGWSSFESTEIASGLSREEAADLERRLILEHKTFDPAYGYNSNKGGLSKTEASTERTEKIRKTLISQRASETARKIMSDRMKAVWSNPARRDAIIRKRKGKLAGRPAVPVLNLDTQTTYPTLHLAATALNVKVPTLSYILAKPGVHTVVSKDGHSHRIARSVALA